jgi:hypothetical protein
VEHIVENTGLNKCYTVEIIDIGSFAVNFNQEEFEKSRSLCEKYVVYSNVPVQEMTAAELRGEYKKLQNVEHAFRDFKSDNIIVRPVYHCNENQTRIQIK